jgi:mannosyl-3-phosphoglycerate phosphatase family protein
MSKILVFTDLDGTLIDHHTYAADSAQKALKQLENRGIPVIFCSSKTFAEQLHLQQKLGVKHPCIVENGSAVAIPRGYFPFVSENMQQISDTHDMIALALKNGRDIAQALEAINKLFHVNLYGYAKSSHKAIAEKTGLKGRAIQRAKNRRFTESLFSAPVNSQALHALESYGLCASQGGRFLTVQDQQVDKGKAVRLVTNLYQRFWQENPLTVGVGDSPNDAPLLTSVNKPFLVQKPDGSWSDIKVNGLIRLEAAGPKGFVEMTKMILVG